jgi:23S rRNA pseudouridine1911/1915/1917 synthase
MTDDGGARRFVVPAAHDGDRLDRFLTAVCPDLSRSRIASDLEDPRTVAVDGRPRAKNFRLSAGQQVDYRPVERQELSAAPQDIPLTVIHEDEHFLVIDKPAGLVVHPAVGHPDGTVVNAILHRQAERRAGGALPGADPLRPGIVHRLDKDTSGLMVVALTETAHRRLSAQLKDRTLGRWYLALSWGRWPEDAGTLEGPVGRHPRKRRLMAVTPGGRDAVTHYEIQEDFEFVQLVRVRLQTGRTHQIRVHFAHFGHPVVGDPQYGDDRRAKGVHGSRRRQADALVAGAGRQLLHAAELHLRHPADGREMTFKAPLPADMEAALSGLRLASRDG